MLVTQQTIFFIETQPANIAKVPVASIVMDKGLLG